jgi:glycerol-1-phosphate dehydrogenase [NAD(P)+]
MNRLWNVEAMMRPYAGRLPTPRVVVERGAIEGAPVVLREALPPGVWMVVADPTTHAAAGERVCAGLRAAGRNALAVVLDAQTAGRPLTADDGKVRELAARIRECPERVTAAVAVGAGTINDLVKVATLDCGLPYAAVPTAPSMNGYTSPIGAILSGGVKTVQPGQVPRAVVADVDVLAAAPRRMIAAGFGDLVSKPVSNADWWMSHCLTGSDYVGEVIELVDQGNRLLEGMAGRLPSADPEAVGCLTVALLLSGFGMALAGTSAPASGGEHLISHYLDMTHYAFGEPNDWHGCQVGVGTRVAAALYEKLLAAGPGGVSVAARVAALAPWPRYERELRERFGALSEAVLPCAREAYPSRRELRGRLERLREQWDALAAALRPGLRPAAAIREDLAAAGCPTTFAEIGVTRERARRAVLHAKDIRARYTVLHLLWEMGVLEAWADEALAPCYGANSNAPQSHAARPS